jgi:sugar phosphate isomerase/epimerase
MGQELMLTRRGFIGAAAGTAAAAATGTWAPSAIGREALVPPGRLGIQLFTVRDAVSRLDMSVIDPLTGEPLRGGFQGVFEVLAAARIREIEFAGYGQGANGPITVAQIRALLDQYALKGIGTHIGYTQFLSNIEQVLDDAEVLGLPYVGTADSPGRVHGETTEGYKRAAEDFNAFGAAAAARGMRFYQHNHSGEFAIDPTTGIRLYDTILAETDPALVFFELDIFWAYVGQSRFPGFDPLQLVVDQPHRFPLYHVKDGVMDGGSTFGWTMTDVGDGQIDFRTFFTVAPSKGSHSYLIERDTAPGGAADPGRSFRTAQRSADYLLGLRAG